MTPMQLGATMRVLRAAPHVWAFYDGRIAAPSAATGGATWRDDALALGTCSYAILDGAEALVYDTHMSVDHAARIRRVLEQAGARRFHVVLSHWHVDHVAGNAAFADGPIIANAETARLLDQNRSALEGGVPPIRPLVLPTQLFDEHLQLTVGGIAVELERFDIHSRDGTVLSLPQAGLVLAGDTLEDPITYVTEPDRLHLHLADLDRLARRPMRCILPNHGAPDKIAAGGYGPGLIGATRRYVTKLLRCRTDPALAAQDLATFLGDDITAGHICTYPPYADVHARNVARVLATTPAA